MFDPNIAPSTLDEYNQLIEYKLAEEQDRYDSECARAMAAAETAWNSSLPEKRAAMIADLKAQCAEGQEVDEASVDASLEREKAQALVNAVSAIQQPQMREQLEVTYSFLLPGITRAPREMPESLGFASDSFYRLDDGRVYSVAEQKFVEDYAGYAIDVVKNGNPAGVEQLKKNLAFYNLPIGQCLKTLEEAKADALATLKAVFKEAEQNGVTTSSLGFEIDATEKADRDIRGLITKLEASGKTSVEFCDAHNQFHDVTLADCKTMQLEVITYGQELYAAKWAKRTAIEAAATFEELNAVELSLAPLAQASE